ncbi:polysaccharide deacetylase family protein [Mucilaginibacter lutimaris]|uniref:Polysaccharide deacetylase family protein n=1 Tax=Mucilaginibacter lutimaris TaxID=931629 RepID=A0ABW2ZL88_9SPHI
MKKRIRYLLSWFISCVLITLGFVRRAKKRALKGEYILSLYYHAPGKELFEFCVLWLKKNNFKVIGQEDILAIVKTEAPIPNGAAIITVDDGWSSNYENVAGIAHKYNVPVTIFVSTEPIENGNYWWPYVNAAISKNLTNETIESLKLLPNNEREKIITQIKQQVTLERQAMTVDQVKEIAKTGLVTIGGHTITHPILPKCDSGTAYQEIKLSKNIIEAWLEKEIITFAYPNGDYTQREITFLEQSGFQLAYTTKPFLLNKEALKSPFTLPRHAIIENISHAEAICRMCGVWQRFF